MNETRMVLVLLGEGYDVSSIAANRLAELESDPVIVASETVTWVSIRHERAKSNVLKRDGLHETMSCFADATHLFQVNHP